MDKWTRLLIFKGFFGGPVTVALCLCFSCTISASPLRYGPVTVALCHFVTVALGRPGVWAAADRLGAGSDECHRCTRPGRERSDGFVTVGEAWPRPALRHSCTMSRRSLQARRATGARLGRPARAVIARRGRKCHRCTMSGGRNGGPKPSPLHYAAASSVGSASPLHYAARGFPDALAKRGIPSEARPGVGFQQVSPLHYVQAQPAATDRVTVALCHWPQGVTPKRHRCTRSGLAGTLMSPLH